MKTLTSLNTDSSEMKSVEKAINKYRNHPSVILINPRKTTTYSSKTTKIY